MEEVHSYQTTGEQVWFSVGYPDCSGWQCSVGNETKSEREILEGGLNHGNGAHWIPADPPICSESLDLVELVIELFDLDEHHVPEPSQVLTGRLEGLTFSLVLLV